MGKQIVFPSGHVEDTDRLKASADYVPIALASDEYARTADLERVIEMTATDDGRYAACPHDYSHGLFSAAQTRLGTQKNVFVGVCKHCLRVDVADVSGAIDAFLERDL